MVHANLIRVLMVEDDEDDFIIVRDLFREIPGERFEVEWARTHEAGLEGMLRNQHDVCLVDYRLGARTGLELLREALEKGCPAPVILLTGLGEREIDLAAMQAGAADYLVKSQLRADGLGRSIRYALERKRAAAQAAFEQARLAAFGAEIGLALSCRVGLEALLERCARAMAQYLNVPLAQVAIFNPGKACYEPRAKAGPLAGRLPGGKPPEVRLDLAALAEGKPLLIKQLAKDNRLSDPEWCQREGLSSYVAYPLVLEEKPVGLLSLFSEQPLTEKILQELGSVANGIALGIERKLSEEALDRSEGKYRAVVENIKEIIFQLDGFGNWVFLNPAWTAVTGFEVKPTLGTFFLEYLASEDREQNRLVFLKLLENGLEYCRYETRFLTRNGKVRWVEVYAQPLREKDGRIQGVSGTLTDISERKNAEVQIQKLAAFPKLSPNPVLEFAADGTLTYSNDAAVEMARSFGKAQVAEILPPRANELARQCLASGQKILHQQVKLEARILTWSFFPIAPSHVVHCYGADVTEVQNLESQLRHAQKLESVGQLAAGVAHDFNNILTIIQGYSECLLARHASDEGLTTPLKQITLASKRAAALTRQLLTFSRRQLIQPKPLDLNSVLQDLVRMLGRLVGEDVALDNRYEPNLPAIEADTGMVEQIVMNLAVNARDAMPKGGRLRIATRRVEVGEAHVRRNADARPGCFVCLSVSDTGCGMDARTRERIFEPFFTTKEVGKGTGLGLATVYGIVKQHKGWIEVTTAPGQGTAFELYFPAMGQPAPATPGVAAAPESAQCGCETILLVEDDPVLREMVREVLTAYEYRVLEAGSGVEALRLWDQQNGEVDLLLTDLVMPEGMNGRELAEQLRGRKPGLKVIYSSGYSAEILGNDLQLSGVWFLPKPYNPTQLAHLVRQCIESSDTSINPAVPARHKTAALVEA